MLGLAEAPAVPDRGRDRRPPRRGHAPRRSTTRRAAVLAPEPLARPARRRRARGARRRCRDARSGDRAPLRARRRVRARRPSRSDVSGPARHRRRRARVRGLLARRRRARRATSPRTSIGRCRPHAPGARAGPRRRRAGQALARDTTARPCCCAPRPYAASSCRSGWHERVRRDAARSPLARAEALLRRRHHRRRRPRPRHRVLPRHPPRHHERRRPRGQLHRLRQLRPQHHDHPRQLRHPRSRSASTSTASSCTSTLEDETGCWIMHSTKGLLWLAHTETAMRARAGPVPAQHGVRRARP